MRAASRAAPGAAVAGVDEERLSGRRDEERRVSAFDVDEIDIESRPRLRRDGQLQGDDRQQQQKAAHGRVLRARS